MVSKVAYVDRIDQFIKTYSMTTKQAAPDGRIFKIYAQAIGKHLKLPTDGFTEGQLLALTKKQHKFIFEGGYPKETRLWRIDKASQHWRH